jgi:ATP-binding cassette subfamily F protein 3
VLVSHDVEFLSPVVNKVVEIRKGKLKIFEGGIDYYLTKRELLLNENEKNSQPASSDADSVSKKDQKRIEAELRQKKYSASKEIVKKIHELEKQIEYLEKKEKELEKTLADKKTYTNPSLAREKTIELNNVKETIETTISEWEKFSEKLNQIEKQFS